MIIVADIGGTTTRVAGSTDGETFGEPIIFDTPADDFESAVEKITDAARVACGDAGISEFIGGIAGRFSKDRKELFLSPHLPGWKNKHVAEALQNALGVPVHLENDVALGGLGEANAGAGVGAPTVAYIAVGTGIGGKKIVDGHLDPAVLDAEIGHEMITIDGVTKELEEFISGTTILKEHGVQASQLHGAAEWDRYSRAFACGLRNVITAWSPDRVVLGGFLCADDRLSISRIEKYLKESGPVPEIMYAKLPYPGLTGALVYAKQKA